MRPIPESVLAQAQHKLSLQSLLDQPFGQPLLPYAQHIVTCANCIHMQPHICVSQTQTYNHEPPHMCKAYPIGKGMGDYLTQQPAHHCCRVGDHPFGEWPFVAKVLPPNAPVGRGNQKKGNTAIGHQSVPPYNIRLAAHYTQYPHGPTICSLSLLRPLWKRP